YRRRPIRPQSGSYPEATRKPAHPAALGRDADPHEYGRLPARYQPARDGRHTTIPNPARDGMPVPALFDDRRRDYDLATCNPCNGYGPANARYQGQGIGEMMPWRTAQPALAQFAQLDSDAHDAV